MAKREKNWVSLSSSFLSLKSSSLATTELALGILTSKSRFGNKRGIPTYNEGGRGETLLGIDMTASLIAAHEAYAKILKISGDTIKSSIHERKAQEERNFLNDFWWDSEKQEYRSIQYADKTFDYFMVGSNGAYIHYVYYFNAIEDQSKIDGIIKKYKDNFSKLIVELKSYLPIMFYENGDTAIANEMIIDLCSPENKRRDYPENSFTVIEHLTRGLMGVNVNAVMNSFSTISRLENDSVWAEMKGVSILENKISISHKGHSESIATNLLGETIKWSAKISGEHEYLYVNGIREKSTIVNDNLAYSYITTNLDSGEQVIVTTKAN